MARGSGRKRTLNTVAAKELKEAVVTKPALRKTRSQSLKENQEIEIQFPSSTHEEEDSFQSSFVDNTVNRRSLSREGSADSAISTNSSKWSLSSNVSIVSRISKSAVMRRLTQTLEPVAEDVSQKKESDVSSDTINWVNSLSTDRGPTATPLIRTHAVANGHLTNRTVSHATDSSNSDSGYNCQMVEETFPRYRIRSEAVIHLHIYVFWALMMSTEHQLRLTSKYDGRHALALHPVALQVAASFFLGILCDWTSPKLALLGPQAICTLLGLLIHLNPNSDHAHLVSYLPFVNSGLLGSQFLAVYLGAGCSQAGVLSRVSLSYGLAAIVCPFVIKVTNNLLGSSFNYQLVTLVSLLSMLAVLRLFASNSKEFPRLLAPTSDNIFSASFVRCCVMKFAITIPASLLLPWLQSVLKDGSGIEGSSLAVLVTVGLLCTQAVMVPLLLLCTVSSTAICAMAFLLTLLYPVMMLLEESGSFLLVVVVPVCGLVAVTQSLVVADLVSTCSCFPGILLAFNITMHILTRHFAPQLAMHFASLCADDRTHLISISCPQFLSHFMKNSSIIESPLLLPTSFEFLSCHKVQLNILAVMGCVCSFLLLIVA